MRSRRASQGSPHRGTDVDLPVLIDESEASVFGVAKARDIRGAAHVKDIVHEVFRDY